MKSWNYIIIILIRQRQLSYYIKNMAKQKPFGDILKELQERKKFEKECSEFSANEPCKRCSNNLTALGRSNVPGVCSICANLALM
jgi:hypothetical protein